MARHVSVAVQLVERCLRNDNQAWKVVEIRTTPVIQRAARATLRRYGLGWHADAVHDITQRVYLRLIKKNYRLLRQFDPKRGSWPRWISRVAHSETLNYLKGRPRMTLPLDESRAGSVDPKIEKALQAAEIISFFYKQLTPTERHIAQLLWGEELAPAEIAAKEGVSPKTVRVHKHNIIKKVEESLYD